MVKRLYRRIYFKLYKRNIKKQLNSQSLRVNGLNIILKNPENIVIGNFCGINNNVYLHGGNGNNGGITIGNNVTISAFSQIYSYQLDTNDWKTNYIEKSHIGKEVFINDGAWIGAGTIIVPGVKITGIGVIIAAGSVVTKSIEEDFVLVGGNPAKIIKRY